MTKSEFYRLHQLILEAKQSMSHDEFIDKIYKVSDAYNPDGIFYNQKERLEYEQLLEILHD